ncbi:helix-turn-helix domain-containing protein [Mucilaginibacter limnophilus]|uniref:helix-turn-helix domain-containing protein n=1 Tax=Mucilaginibacter limnophilus TaxID=1932778 RepID=UPI0013E2C871|nr:helix-turn-helix transcriptional regulator [Mucilaginibacter limnophilus]
MEADFKKFKIQFGQNVKRLRLSNKYTQDELAVASELADGKFISRIESGEKDIQLLTIFKLAKGLNVAPKILLDFEI